MSHAAANVAIAADDWASVRCMDGASQSAARPASVGALTGCGNRADHTRGAPCGAPPASTGTVRCLRWLRRRMRLRPECALEVARDDSLPPDGDDQLRDAGDES